MQQYSFDRLFRRVLRRTCLIGSLGCAVLSIALVCAHELPAGYAFSLLASVAMTIACNMDAE
jgi:hypothetical protein